MCRKIYPVAIIVSLPLVFFVFFVMNQGYFEELSQAAYPNGEELYLEYDMKWKGFGTPQIESIHLLDERTDAQLEDITLSTFVQAVPAENENLLTEIDMEAAADDLLPVADYKIDDDSFRLIVKVNYEEESTLEEMNTVSISYRIFGIRKEQQVKFD